jgi:hypothetical protein
MRRGFCFAIFAAGLFVSVSLASASEIKNCDLAQISTSRELHNTLSRRAVEIVDRASRSAWRTDARLADLVAPSARFSLGVGDVVRPAGTGIEGARALTLLMNADTFRFDGWNYLDSPADPCADQGIDVEFLDGNLSFRMRFTFQAGRVISAGGWQRSIVIGNLAAPEAQE